MKSQWLLILSFLFALIIALFAVINVNPVEVNFLFGKTQTPLILVILFSTLFGGLSVGSFGIVRVFMLQRKVKQYEKQLAGTKEDIKDLDGSQETSEASQSTVNSQEGNI